MIQNMSFRIQFCNWQSILPLWRCKNDKRLVLLCSRHSYNDFITSLQSNQEGLLDVIFPCSTSKSHFSSLSWYLHSQINGECKKNLKNLEEMDLYENIEKVTSCNNLKNCEVSGLKQHHQFGNVQATTHVNHLQDLIIDNTDIFIQNMVMIWRDAHNRKDKHVELLQQHLEETLISLGTFYPSKTEKMYLLQGIFSNLILQTWLKISSDHSEVINLDLDLQTKFIKVIFDRLLRSVRRKHVKDFPSKKEKQLIRSILLQQKSLNSQQLHRIRDDLMKSMKSNLSSSSIDRILREQIQILERKKITKTHRQIVRNFLIENVNIDKAPTDPAPVPIHKVNDSFEHNQEIKSLLNRTDIVGITEQLENILPISKRCIYEIVINELRKLERKPIAIELHEYIYNYVTIQSNLNDIPSIVSQLKERNLPISDRQLYELIRKAVLSITKKKIDPATRMQIREHIQSLYPIVDNATNICEHIRHTFDIPSHQLYDIVSYELKLQKTTIEKSKRKSRKSDLDLSYRNQFKDVVHEYIHNNMVSNSKFSIPMACSQLQKLIPLSRSEIYILIANHIRRLKKRPISSEDREIVASIVKDKVNLLGVFQAKKYSSSICDEIQRSSSISRIQIQDLVRNELKKYERRIRSHKS